MNIMIVLMAALASLTVAGCGKKGGGGGDAVAKYEEWTKAMCACKAGDTACAKKVTDEQLKWGEEQAKTVDKNAKVDPKEAEAMAAKMKPIMEEFAKCSAKAMTQAGAGTEPAAGGAEPAAGGTDAKKLAAEAMAKFEAWTKEMCACKAGDADCAKKITDAQAKWGEEMAKANKDVKPDPKDAEEMAAKMKPVMDEFTKCATAAMTPAK